MSSPLFTSTAIFLWHRSCRRLPCGISHELSIALSNGKHSRDTGHLLPPAEVHVPHCGNACTTPCLRMLRLYRRPHIVECDDGGTGFTCANDEAPAPALDLGCRGAGGVLRLFRYCPGLRRWNDGSTHRATCDVVIRGACVSLKVFLQLRFVGCADLGDAATLNPTNQRRRERRMN